MQFINSDYRLHLVNIDLTQLWIIEQGLCQLMTISTALSRAQLSSEHTQIFIGAVGIQIVEIGFDCSGHGIKLSHLMLAICRAAQRHQTTAFLVAPLPKQIVSQENNLLDILVFPNASAGIAKRKQIMEPGSEDPDEDLQGV